MNLYRKLLLAQSPLALALAIVGVVSVVVISFLGSHSQTILKDNYRSVLAAQRMKEAMERMDSAALFIVAGERQKGAEQAEKYRPIFETELKVQEETLPRREKRNSPRDCAPLGRTIWPSSIVCRKPQLPTRPGGSISPSWKRHSTR